MNSKLHIDQSEYCIFQVYGTLVHKTHTDSGRKNSELYSSNCWYVRQMVTSIAITNKTHTHHKTQYRGSPLCKFPISISLHILPQIFKEVHIKFPCISKEIHWCTTNSSTENSFSPFGPRPTYIHYNNFHISLLFPCKK